ncbi:hypothetical protein EJ04DRAFT_467568 [Polyplosphaeria fusca]|uniref:Zn(2)-C6 fungal-type domain-containing protein n=1 Tax=Polyplosphaeria fusca TaxID=682080 RepID=A0A9P4QWX2_9PLEO|nr:hypothetical protein EJ04DRAFT_467568 [Polyplosphaeria fusca]
MDDDRCSTSDSQPPAKRQRTLACRRCRTRKQRCEETRPCTNCVKSEEECLPTAPAPRMHADSDYVRILEERIAELESLDPQQSLDHIRSSNGAATHHSRTFSTEEPINGSNPEAVSITDASPDELPRVPSRSAADSSPAHVFVARVDEDVGMDHLILGLVASPSAPRPEHAASICEASPNVDRATPSHREIWQQSLVGDVPLDLAELLLDAYRERAQSQYPFLYWDAFMSWHMDWRNCSTSDGKSRAWQGFFVNLVYATSLVLLRRPSVVGRSDAYSFYRNGIALLPSVLEKPDQILHTQAYLLLAMHALHQSSTERIISLASTTIRYCVQQQLHLFETEPDVVDHTTQLDIQIRRRCFWCAYKLDRLVMMTFDLPPSIPDAMITARTFANLDDRDLLQAATVTPPGLPLEDAPHYTCVSSSLHILQCRRIQSEISSITLRYDYASHYENSPEWRVRILAELENYKARVQKFSDPQSKGYTSQRWLAMIYHYTLLMLYRPTKESVLGPAGDWSVQASTQACLMFRKTQMDRQIAQPWLGLLVQFQSGITLLYCFWATPPESRTDNFDSLDVPDALRACSNILAIMADRWAKADCLRDVFELLAREIPLVDRPSRPPTRLSDKTVVAIQEKLPQLRALIVHRSILRMLDEMINEDFPRSRGNQGITRPPSVAGMLAPIVTPLSANRSGTATPSANMAFQLPFSTQPFNFDGNGIDMQDLNLEGLPSFPGVFDFETWG